MNDLDMNDLDMIDFEIDMLTFVIMRENPNLSYEEAYKQAVEETKEDKSQ